MDIVVWLRSLGLGRYEAAFRENDIDETVLPGLTHETLKELGVVSIGHRVKLLDAIAALHSDASGKTPSVDATTTSSAPAGDAIAALRSDASGKTPSVDSTTTSSAPAGTSRAQTAGDNSTTILEGIAALDLRVVNELRKNEVRLEEAQRIAHFGWWERDFNTGHVSLSDELCRIFGVQPADIPEWHQRWLKLIHPEDRPRVTEAAAAALRGGPRYDVEYRVVRSDGAVRVVHSRGDVTWDDAGRPLRQFGVLQDITELRRAERELRTSEARFRTFVDHAMDAFFLLDDRLTVLDVNRQACESLGYSREELVGMHPRDFDAGLDESAVERLRQRIAAGETLTFETCHRRKDGTSFPVEVHAGQFEPGGRHLCLVRDITERKLVERTDEVEKLNQQLEQRVAHQVSEIERMGRLRRFLPPQVADLIVASGTEKQLGSHRREITALFCDLRGFTGFSESSDPEDVMALLRDYHAAIGEIIIKYSGTLERFAGDGVMVIFNDPVPVDNPALQAVLMALEMRDAIGALTEKWRRLGHDIGFGIGIAHGFATLGTIGFEGRFDYAAIGTVSNVASRLCDEAKPGQILISPRVLTKVENAVKVDPVGEFELKGIRRPLAAYNVVGVVS